MSREEMNKLAEKLSFFFHMNLLLTITNKKRISDIGPAYIYIYMDIDIRQKKKERCLHMNCFFFKAFRLMIQLMFKITT